MVATEHPVSRGACVVSRGSSLLGEKRRAKARLTHLTTTMDLVQR